MIEVLHQSTVEEPVKVDAPATAIRATGPMPLRAAAVVASGYLMPYGSAELNSRLPGALPSGPLKIRWQASLNPAFPPAFVVQAGDRILTQGGGLWQLFGADGKPVGEGRYGPSHVVLDPEHGLLYFVDADNFIVALKMATAAKLFMTSASFGDNFTRPLLVRKGNRLVIAGVEQGGSAHRPEPPNLSLIEFDDLADKLEVDSSGLLFSLTATAKLLVRTTKLQVAIHGDTIVFAVPGRIYESSTDMKLQRAIEADFEPVMMSLDEASRIYLIVHRGGRRELWIITSDGGLVGSATLGHELDSLLAPPIVGYDHRVYLLTPTSVACFDADGKLLWNTPLNANAAGAAVTSDGQLILSAGRELVAFDGQGHRKLVYEFQGEPLVSGPVVTTQGEILVASRNHLYCLAVQR